MNIKKFNVPVAMKPWSTLKGLLLHPKEKLKIRRKMSHSVFTGFIVQTVIKLT